MIATKAGPEGINLQFCSLGINYDLPWNSLRIEQRIGRRHRYGQKFYVVVVNFIDHSNGAGARVCELLSHKFPLFGGVSGPVTKLSARLAPVLTSSGVLPSSTRTADSLRKSRPASSNSSSTFPARSTIRWLRPAICL
nr:C-terminal helicase domain-containing protein [Acidiferrobacter sp.]